MQHLVKQAFRLTVCLKGIHFHESIFTLFVVVFDISSITVCFCYGNLECLDTASLGILMIMSVKVILKVLLQEYKQIRNSTFLCTCVQNCSVFREVSLDRYQFIS